MEQHIDELRAALKTAKRLVRELERITKAYDGAADDDDEHDPNAEDE